MFISFLILIIVSILKIGITELSTRFDFLSSTLIYLNISFWFALILFLLFTLVSIIKAFKK